MIEFGIIIPNLNKTKFLSTALESAVHQTVTKKIIVVDGGSTDGIEKVIDNYRDAIDIYISERDNGQSHAIAKGAAETKADIFCWLNSDDYYFPYCLDRVAAIFTNNPDIDVIYGDAVHVDENGSFISYFHPAREYEKRKLAFDNYICQPACFVKREMYERVGAIKNDLDYTMDWDLWCRLSIVDAKFYYLKQPLAAVRYYKGTKTFSNSAKRYWEILRINSKYGRTLFPVSLIGLNYYELTLKKSRNYLENGYIKLIHALRHIKYRKQCRHIILNHQNQLYGLEKWTNRVNRECHIYLPWYSEFKWRFIIFRVDNSMYDFEIAVSNKIIEHRIVDRRTISIPISRNNSSTVHIKIGTKTDTIWQLQKVVCSESP
jgi:glycosyltransferase involved in cell wall biosynthesis